MDAFCIPATLASFLLQNVLCPFGPQCRLFPMPGLIFFRFLMANLFSSLNLNSNPPSSEKLSLRFLGPDVSLSSNLAFFHDIYKHL